MRFEKVENEKVDWIGVVRHVYSERKKFIVSIAIFLVIGVLIAVNMEETYTSNAVFISQFNSTSRAGLSNVAALAGIDLRNGNTTTEIPVGLYPKITKSVIFKREVINTKIRISGIDSLVTYREYYEEIFKPSNLSVFKKYTIGLPSFILSTLRSNPEISNDVQEFDSNNRSSLIRLSQLEFNHFRRLDGQMEVRPNEKEGYIELYFSMPDPVAAAEMASIVLELLQREVIAYKINSAKEQLAYTEMLYEEKKTEFEALQSRLSTYRDRNLNITSEVARSNLQKIEAEYNLKLNVYQDLARQLEASKIQVKKDTPVFSVIDPVIIPFQRSAPNKPIIVILSFILGLVFAVIWIGVNAFYGDLRKLLEGRNNVKG